MKKHVRVLEERGSSRREGRADAPVQLAPQPLDGIEAWLQRLDRFADSSNAERRRRRDRRPNDREIRLERVFDAPRDRVFAVWTDPS